MSTELWKHTGTFFILLRIVDRQRIGTFRNKQPGRERGRESETSCQSLCLVLKTDSTMPLHTKSIWTRIVTKNMTTTEFEKKNCFPTHSMFHSDVKNIIFMSQDSVAVGICTLTSTSTLLDAEPP